MQLGKLKQGADRPKLRETRPWRTLHVRRAAWSSCLIQASAARVAWGEDLTDSETIDGHVPAAKLPLLGLLHIKIPLWLWWVRCSVSARVQSCRFCRSNFSEVRIPSAYSAKKSSRPTCGATCPAGSCSYSRTFPSSATTMWNTVYVWNITADSGIRKRWINGVVGFFLFSFGWRNMIVNNLGLRWSCAGHRV